MTDTTPPPTDKKPRRRSAPRKRSAAKRSENTEAALAVEVADAPATGNVGADSDSASSPAAVAARLDPKPLADAGDRGDAPASDSPLATTKAAADGIARPARHSRRAKAERGATTPVEPAAAPAATPAPEAKRTTSPPPSPPAAAPADAAAAPFPKQAELRPGELIRVPLSVRWRDLDAFNHVNNSKYLSYLEEARLRWMLAMPGMGMDDDVAPVVAASNLNYRRPIEWPGDVVVELFVERLGGSSLTIGHRIVDSKHGGTLYCDGHVVMVGIDRNSGRSAPLPESVRAACR
jgi:YbgC/YbaW family acyl-CoA thioester hydrolase